MDGKRVKPVRPIKTLCKTAWQACKTDKTVRFSKKNEGGHIFIEIERFYGFYTPAMRFFTWF